MRDNNTIPFFHIVNLSTGLRRSQFYETMSKRVNSGGLFFEPPGEVRDDHSLERGAAKILIIEIDIANDDCGWFLRFAVAAARHGS